MRSAASNHLSSADPVRAVSKLKVLAYINAAISVLDESLSFKRSSINSCEQNCFSPCNNVFFLFFFSN